MKNDQRILELVKEKIAAEYQDDISMLVVYGNKKESRARNLGLGFYVIPKTDRGRSLSTQFIVDGVSYDLFPISWDRLIANAAMDSPQGYLLLDTEVAYCSDQAALDRFNGLKESLEAMMDGAYEEALLNKAYEYFNESPIYLYNMIVAAKDLKSVRLEAGKLLNKIANALAFANGTYYKNGNGSVLRDSLKLEKLPDGYEALVQAVMFGEEGEKVYRHSCALVDAVRAFLLEIKRGGGQPEAFETLFVGYYEELVKSINKCRNAVAEKDYYALYELSAFMQEEVAQFLAKLEEGVWYDDRNVFSEFDKAYMETFGETLLAPIGERDDPGIVSALDAFDGRIRRLMEEAGIEILEFASVDAFENFFLKRKASGEV